MYLASAYPNSAISAGAMMAIAFVMVSVLAFWLIMVYVADRQGGKPAARQADSRLTPVAGQEEVAEDEHSEAGSAPAGERRGAAA
ncbi:MAG TPA: hypothetical protein VFO01_04355 [Trebonia sp.]|nr:hypothetical protein [Trebonia sp.]